MNEPTHPPLTASELSELIGVRLSAISNWRRRFPDFPASIDKAAPERFATADLVSWLCTRRIPRNLIRVGEVPGATYADRLRHQLAADSGPALTPIPETTSGPDFAARLWTVLDRLRGSYSPDRAQELVICLIYVRMVDPETWRLVASARDWQQARAWLLGARDRAEGAGGVLRRFQEDLPFAENSPISEAIRVVDEMLPGQGFAERATEELLERLGRKAGRGGGRYTPATVARCLIGLVDPRPGDQVFDPACGSAELLIAAAQHVAVRSASGSDWVSLVGGVQTDWDGVTAHVNLAVHAVDGSLRPTTVTAGHTFQRFDIVVTNPPFAQRSEPFEPQEWPFGDPGRSTQFAWLQRVHQSLAPSGRAAVVLPTGATSRRDTTAEIRSRMVEAGVIECVVALPKGLFRHTDIQPMVWVLRGWGPAAQHSSSVLMLDAAATGSDRGGEHTLDDRTTARIVEHLRRWRDGAREDALTEEGFARVVDLETLRGNDFDLSPSQYCASTYHTDRVQPSVAIATVTQTLADLRVRAREVDDRAADVLARNAGKDSTVARRYRLSEISDILSGPGSVTRVDGQCGSGDIALVLPRNVRDRRISAMNVDRVSADTAHKLARYELAVGDIVTPRAGTLGRFGLVGTENHGWLLGPGCMRLRATLDVDPQFLVYMLNSTVAQRWLSSNSTGSPIPSINVSTLGSMPMTIPPLAQQLEVVELLDAIDDSARIHSRISGLLDDLGDLLVVPDGSEKD